MKTHYLIISLFIAFLFSSGRMDAQELPDISSVPADLVVPAITVHEPGRGLRVRQTTPGWESTRVYHTLYLPRNWKAGSRFPVIVEYAGNGNFRNQYGDSCNGMPEGCSLGYGLSGGKDFIWVCLPFVDTAGGIKHNAVNWWGDIDETRRYTIATLNDLAGAFGADTACVILAGFSRGAIACNYIGLCDDETAPVWRAFFCHSHYDGVYEHWPYPRADRASALTRLQRLKGRPQWISQEGSVKNIQDYLLETGVKGDFTFQSIPFRNHTDRWVLRNIPQRKAARAWLRRVVETSSSTKR